MSVLVRHGGAGLAGWLLVVGLQLVGRGARAEQVPSPDAGSAAPAKVPLEQAMDQGIVEISETKWTVDRALLERLLSPEADHLWSQARLLPYERGGRVAGIKIYGVRRRSVFGRLGLRNGDILNKLAGVTITATDHVAEAFQKCKGLTNIVAEITRRGRRLTLSYEVR